VFATGAGLYVLAYVGFATVGHNPAVLAVFFALAGAGIGLAETAESTLVAHLLPDHLRGSGFGLLGLTQSLAAFASTAAAGLLWSTVSPTLAFGYAAAWMLIAITVLGVQRRSARRGAAGRQAPT
jgi:MFS family permease